MGFKLVWEFLFFVDVGSGWVYGSMGVESHPFCAKVEGSSGR